MLRAGFRIFCDTGASQVSNNLGNAAYGVSASVNYTVDNATLGAPPDTAILNLAHVFPAPQTTALGQFPIPTGPGEGYEGDGALATVTYYDQKSAPLPYYERVLVDVQQQVAAH